ncbi:MAG: ferritin family protein [Thermodesulfobacteriota bacterium]
MIEHIDQTIIDRLQTALTTEMEGYGFYNEISKKIEDEKGKNFFKHLAADELDHMKVVLAISDSVKAGKGWIGYNEATSDDHTKGAGLPIFPDKNSMLDKLGPDGTDIEALEIALKSEEEAVKLYSEMLTDAGDDTEKEVLTKLVEMEKAHYDILRWEKDSLMNMGFWADHMEFTVEGER